MASIDKILDMIDEDFGIDDTKLGEEVIRSADLFRKYLRLRTTENIKLNAMESELLVLIKDKQEYYKGQAPAEVYREKPFDNYVKTDVALARYIDADTDIIAHKLKIAIQKEKIAIISAAFDEIKRRGYNIKSRIDYEKYLNGSF